MQRLWLHPHLQLHLLWLAFLLASLLPAAAEELPVESWSVIYKYGTRIGYSHTTLYRGPDGSIVCESEDESTERRMGTPVTRRNFSSFVETKDGQPVRFTYRNPPVEKNGEIHGSVLNVTIDNAGEVTRQEFPWDSTVLFPYSASRSLGPIELKPGAEFAYKTLSVGVSMTGQTLRFRVEGRQNVALLDRRVDLWRCRVTMDEVPGFEMVQYLTDNLDCLKSEIPSAGLVTIQGSKQLALAPLDPAETPDAVLSAGVRSNVYLWKPRQLSAARYRVNGAANLTSGEITVQPPLWPGGAAAGQDDPRYLAPNSWIHADHPSIKKLVAEVAPGGTHAEAAQALRDWVHREIRRETLDVGFASDLDTLASRRGDCTEHAVLLASLCRARGIPARLATGLAYAGGMFLGHAWTEVKLGDAWYPLDAALSTPPPLSVDATHIKLSDSSLHDPNPPAELGNTVASLGKMRLEILDYTLGGKTYQAADSGPVEADGRVDWPTLGVSLAVPPGWEVSTEVDYPWFLALVSGKSKLTLSTQEYAGTEFATLVDTMGGGLSNPRLERRIDGHRAVLVVGGDPDKREVKLLVDRGDTYLAMQLLGVSDKGVADFMAVVNSLKLKEP